MNQKKISFVASALLVSLALISGSTAYSRGTEQRAGTTPREERDEMGMTATPEARKEMAQMMREMADCLDTTKTFMECHREVHRGRNFRISVEKERAGTTGESRIHERTETREQERKEEHK